MLVHRIASVAILFVLSTALRAQDARDLLNLGVQAFREGRYEEAVADFRQAVSRDPNDATAHLYLATASMSLWIPGVDSPENSQNARNAENEFKRVMELDPKDITPLTSLASMSYMKAATLPERERAGKFDEARDQYRHILQIDPMNREAYYTLGVIAWQDSHPSILAARLELSMTPEAPGPLSDAFVREKLKGAYGPVIEQGISHLTAALRLDPQYDDAMAYMNLLLRARADLRDSPEESAQDVSTADGWLQRALETKKAKAANLELPPTPIAGNVQAQRLIFKVDPVYPREPGVQVQGAVRLSVTIGKDGRVTKIQLISGNPLLIPATLTAVQQWVYKPTFLNGEPVEVMTDVEINFTVPPGN